MEIEIGQEKIIELRGPFTPDEIHERALARRVDAFGQLIKFMQRPRPEEIQVGQVQKRFEPFWFGRARALYRYDRRHHYDVPVGPEVQSIELYEHPHTVTSAHTFGLDALEHCEEELNREYFLDAQSGDERDYTRYVAFTRVEVPDLSALQADDTVVIMPEVRSSFLVGKLTQALMKTIQADTIYEQRIDIQEVVLYYRPVYAFEFLWKGRDKRSVVEFDALTGEQRAEPGQIKKQLVRVLDNDDLFDIGADAVGTFVPGANLAVKLGRLAARKALR